MLKLKNYSASNHITSIGPLAVLSLLTLAIVGFAPSRARASSPGGIYGIPVTAQILTSIAAAPNGGFWVQLQDIRPGYQDPRLDGTYAIEGAPQHDNYQHRGNIVAVPGTNGYWIVTADGKIVSRGGAATICEGELSSCSNFPEEPNSEQIIVGAAATPTGNGLWAVSRDGSLWTAGDARPYGDVRNQPPITGIIGTPSGNGYYIVASDGGVFSFGDAEFHGSTGGHKPGGHEVTGIAVSINASGHVNGYWLVADDGGVFTFGQAPFWGSTGGNDGGSPVISITSFPRLTQTQGYAWVHANGSIGAAWRPINARTPH